MIMDNILQQSNIKKVFNQWKINLIKDFDSIIFKIENDFNLFQSSYNCKYFQSLISSNHSIDEIFDIILNYFDNNKIKIEENEKYLKLIFINNNKNFEIKINEMSKLSEEIIKKLIQEIKNLKEENKRLELRMINLEKDTIKEIKEKKIVEKKVVIKAEDNKEDLKNEIKNIANNLNKNQLNNYNLKIINAIKTHNKSIYSLSIFPSGNIISVSADKSIKIYDNNFKIIQNIVNAHDDDIFDVSIKDENNFATCSKDKNIKIWIKNEGVFNLNKTIYNAHDDSINKIIYYLNENIISCSFDKKIKIWEEFKNNIYKCVKILTHDNIITSILLLKDKKILISSGLDGTKFWNFINYENIICIKEAICRGNNALKIIDEDRIIVGGDNDGIIKIISINENKIIKNINNGFKCYGICIIENKGIFLIGGVSKEMKIYRIDNYSCIKIIKEVHKYYISGIIELNEETIATYEDDKTIKIWSFE